MEDKIYILMATYNGENFISEQLQSIRRQTYSNWELIIRDDNSTDNTVEIIQKYMTLDKRIRLIEDDLENLGQCLNFKELLYYVEDASFVMFSDQDDIWLPNKIQMTLNKMLSNDYNSNIPRLVYTNYIDMVHSTQSMKIAYNNCKNKDNIAKNLLIQNWIMGCTMMINSKLVEIGRDIAIEADNHDAWFAIIASLCGEILYEHIPSMIHITHTNNVTGRENAQTFKNRLLRVARSIKNSNYMIDKKVKLINKLTPIILENGKEDKEDFFYFKNAINIKKIKGMKILYNNNFQAYNKTQTVLFYLSLLN